MAEVGRAVSLVVKWAMAPAKIGKVRMGIARMPETRPTQRFEPVSSYMAQDCAAVRALVGTCCRIGYGHCLVAGDGMRSKKRLA